MRNLFKFCFMPNLPQAGETIMNVANFEGLESISGLYEYKITICVENLPNIDNFINKLLRHRVTLTIQNGILDRDVCGIISEVSYKGEYLSRVFFEVLLVPQVSLLKENCKSRVFLNLSIPQIINNVLAEETRSLGLVSIDLSSIDMSKYNKEAMICQYNESSWDFISRLMEKVGIYYYFKQPENQGMFSVGAMKVETLVLSDNKAHERSMTPKFLHLGQKGSDEKDCLYDLNVKFSRTSASCIVRGYDWDKNRTQALKPNVTNNVEIEESSADIMRQVNRAVIDNFDPNILDQDAILFAQICAEREATKSEVAVAKTTCSSVEAGCRFRVTGSNFVNKHQWLLTRVKHVGRQASFMLAGLNNDNINESDSFYYNEIEAIPANVQYRPMLTTRVPVINGVIPAIVEGQDGEIHACMDELGRYKVRFCFDNEQKSTGLASCWLKLMTPFGGTDGTSGIHFPLLGGAQVLVGFIGGAIDKPYIAGAIADASGLVSNSDFIGCSVIRSPYGNSIVMGDYEEGKEFLLLKNSNGYRVLGDIPDDVLSKF